ncbi:MAG: membrane protein insertase YidC, partial [Candidatus Kapabacteria bacterium]|nr:membrane protein insertase YidC [Candidatus Kapabacteria bacterium]MDW7996899.1 membrane protein insertase YidC [Bacteroidota bacterium]
MDKRMLLGIILIVLLTTVWMVYTSIYFAPRVPSDTARVERVAKPTPAVDRVMLDTAPRVPEHWVEVETELLRVRLSSHGAVVHRWELLRYKDWRGNPVQLVPPGERVLSITYYDHQGKRVDTRQLPFVFMVIPDSVYRVSGRDSIVIRARYLVDSLRFIERWYVFYGDRYDVQVGVRLVNMENLIAQRRYELTWSGGVKYQEYNSVDESNTAQAMISLAGELEELDAHDFAQPVETQATGQIDWVGIRVKY